MTPPLSKMKVLDLTQVMAGPFCCQVLADMGADVTKVEPPQTGDQARHAMGFRMEKGEDGIAYEKRMERVVGRLEVVRKPTIAVIDGYAIGGGLSIAAVSDLRLCTPEAKFGMPIARTLGNCLSIENYARLVALIGPARTKQLIYTARMFSAEEALAVGLATEVVPREELDERVGELCASLEDHAPITMRVTKEAIRRLTLTGLPDASDLVLETYGSHDFHEGVAAFTEKRRPDWQGR